jgi:hypothetical protein
LTPIREPARVAGFLLSRHRSPLIDPTACEVQWRQIEASSEQQRGPRHAGLLLICTGL